LRFSRGLAQKILRELKRGLKWGIFMSTRHAPPFRPDCSFMSSIDSSLAAAVPEQSKTVAGDAAPTAQQKIGAQAWVVQKEALAAPLASLKAPVGEEPSLRLSSILAFAGLRAPGAQESRVFFEQALSQESLLGASPERQGALAQWGEWACHADRPEAVEALWSMGLDWLRAQAAFDPRTDATVEFLRSAPGRAVRDASGQPCAKAPLLSRLLSLDASQSLARLANLGVVSASTLAKGSAWAEEAARKEAPLALLPAALSHEAWACVAQITGAENMPLTQGELDQSLWICAQNPSPLTESWFGWIHWLLERGANPFRAWGSAFSRAQSDDGPVSAYASPAQKGPVLRDVARDAEWDAPVLAAPETPKRGFSPVMDCSPLQMSLNAALGAAFASAKTREESQMDGESKNGAENAEWELAPLDAPVAQPADCAAARQALWLRIDAGAAEQGWDCARAFLMRMVDTEAEGCMAAGSYDGWIHVIQAIDWAQAPNGPWGESPLMFLMSLSLAGGRNPGLHAHWRGERAFSALMACDTRAFTPAEPPDLPCVAELALVLSLSKQQNFLKEEPMVGPLEALASFALARDAAHGGSASAPRPLGHRELARAARAVASRASEKVNKDARRAGLLSDMGGWTIKWADRLDGGNWILPNLLQNPGFLALCDPAALSDWRIFCERWTVFEAACDELHKLGKEKPQYVEKQRAALDSLELNAQWWLQRVEADASDAGQDLALEPKSDKKKGGSASSGAKRL